MFYSPAQILSWFYNDSKYLIGQITVFFQIHVIITLLKTFLKQQNKAFYIGKPETYKSGQNSIMNIDTSPNYNTYQLMVNLVSSTPLPTTLLPCIIWKHSQDSTSFHTNTLESLKIKNYLKNITTMLFSHVKNF